MFTFSLNSVQAISLSCHFRSISGDSSEKSYSFDKRSLPVSASKTTVKMIDHRA